VVKALCLGARAVLIGRAFAYGLGAAGGEGVSRAIDILRSGVVRTMKLLGCASVGELDRSFVRCRRGSTTETQSSQRNKETDDILCVL
jgi:L-lactate dehydrogenase (cytochrome)